MVIQQTMSRRLVTCFHESAHAVVRVMMGLPFEKIEVYDNPTVGADGYLTVLENFPLYRTEHRHAAVVSALASIPCEMWLDPVYGYRPRRRQPRSNRGIGRFLIISTTACKDDFDGAKRMADLFDISLDQALNKAFALVYQNWDAIVRVAEVLNSAGVLHSGEVGALCPPDAHTGFPGMRYTSNVK